jgi:thiol-disulfide isomerase/thioredoxin
MKKYLFTLLAVIASICGCDDTGTQPTGEIQLASSSKDVIEIKPEGGKETVRFSSALEWHIEFSDDWLTVDPMEGGPGTAKISISADVNEESESRQAVVNICTGGLEYPITVKQEAFIPTLELLETEKEISCVGGEIIINVHTDIEFDFQCDVDWVKSASVKAPRTRKVPFTVEPNTVPETRQANITFFAGDITRTYTLTQRPAGTEGDDWKHDDFVRRSLAMRFTGDWCGYCPYMATAFDSAKQHAGDEMVILNIHGGGSTYDFPSADTYIKRFAVRGFPTGVIDTRAVVQNDEPSVVSSIVVDLIEESQNAYPSKSGIALNSSLDGSSLTVDLTLFFKEADAYRVVVLLLEDGIKGRQAGVSGTYTHNDVARVALTSVDGEAVDIADDNTVWTKTYKKELNSKWNPENMEVLVYVEKPYGDQTVVKDVPSAKYGNYGERYTDNCRVVKIGEAANLELK